MKLGVFDSGLGGLLIAKSIKEKMPEIDIIYFGDTLHLPYGNRSGEAIYEYSKRAIDFLFSEECALIITACNTVSASVLRKLQQLYLPNSPYSERRILGVIVPTLETAIEKNHKNIGVIATNHTIETNIYPYELQKIDSNIKIVQQSTPLLVPLIENNGAQLLPSVLASYLEPMVKNDIECLILGCTHYPFLKEEIKKIVGDNISLISQDEIIPDKLIDYLTRHQEISNKINKQGNTSFYVSDITQSYIDAAKHIYKSNINIKLAKLNLNNNIYEK